MKNVPEDEEEDEVTPKATGNVAQEIDDDNSQQAEEIKEDVETPEEDKAEEKEEHIGSNENLKTEQIETDNYEKFGENRVKVRNPYNKALKFRDVLQKGAKIRYLTTGSDDWNTGILVNRYGKVTGKTPNGWNVQVDGNIKHIDFDVEVQEVERISLAAIEEEWEDSISNEMVVSQVFCVQLNHQITEAKQNYKAHKRKKMELLVLLL